MVEKEGLLSEEIMSCLLFSFEQSSTAILNWKAHLLRSVNQDFAKQAALEQLDDDMALIIMDWAMKFLPLRYREQMSEFFGKRGRSWHVTAVITIGKEGKYDVECFVHVFNNGEIETWTVYSRQEKKTQQFHLRCLRKILYIKWKDKVTDEQVLQQAGALSLFKILRRNRLRWLGHVSRMDDSRLPKKVLYGELATESIRKQRSGVDERNHQRRMTKPKSTVADSAAEPVGPASAVSATRGTARRGPQRTTELQTV
ncbi:hypothetical protein Bbelb_109510 [Branchiostoma belcheri]|nr:hypothetical protein Bbelb_109510 [Branchiostoma belcheri]